jgi:outer membrane protein OmpA-like peptidoglycan-associated protein
MLPAPTVEASTATTDHPTVNGTWPAGIATGLTVELDGVTHKLGKDYDLLSDASGKWTLTPKAPVVNGTYNVIATAMGADGKSVSDATKGELTVNVAPPPPAPPAAQPYDCEATLARIAAVFPVRFEYSHDDLAGAFALSVNQYAALLKDPRCVALKMNVAGHTDFIGSETYNQGLSERRAKTVVDALVKAGVDAARLTPLGFSKGKPIDPAKSDDARAKNRRVEFTVAK